MSNPVSDLARLKATRHLLGDDWRADRPLEIAGLIGAIVEGTVVDYAQYQKLVGEIRGVRTTLDLLTQANQEVNGEP